MQWLHTSSTFVWCCIILRAILIQCHHNNLVRRIPRLCLTKWIFVHFITCIILASHQDFEIRFSCVANSCVIQWSYIGCIHLARNEGIGSTASITYHLSPITSSAKTPTILLLYDRITKTKTQNYQKHWFYFVYLIVIIIPTFFSQPISVCAAAEAGETHVYG